MEWEEESILVEETLITCNIGMHLESAPPYGNGMYLLLLPLHYVGHIGHYENVQGGAEPLRYKGTDS